MNGWAFVIGMVIFGMMVMDGLSTIGEGLKELARTLSEKKSEVKKDVASS